MSAKKRARRASRRAGINIDLADEALKDLMIEQYRDEGEYITVYGGTRAELVSAGVPDSIFEGVRSKTVEFKVSTLNACYTGSCEVLEGSLAAVPTGYELEIHWGTIRPYIQGSHPVITELARMMLKDILFWQGDDSLTAPFDQLAEDPRATDYKPLKNSARLQTTPEFRKALSDLAHIVYEFVHKHGEVMVCESNKPVPKERPTLRVVQGSGDHI